METKDSLPCSQKPANCPYPQTCEPSPHSPIYALGLVTLSFRYLHQNSARILLPHRFHTARPSRSPRFEHPNNIWRDLRMIKFLLTRVLLSYPQFLLVRLKYLPLAPYSCNTLCICSSLNVRDKVSI
jgi:hypothetical protein